MRLFSQQRPEGTHSDTFLSPRSFFGLSRPPGSPGKSATPAALFGSKRSMSSSSLSPPGRGTRTPGTAILGTPDDQPSGRAGSHRSYRGGEVLLLHGPENRRELPGPLLPRRTITHLTRTQGEAAHVRALSQNGLSHGLGFRVLGFRLPTPPTTMASTVWLSNPRASCLDELVHDLPQGKIYMYTPICTFPTVCMHTNQQISKYIHYI